jgi:RNA polymerase sigma-70 factor, ECF subfamily
VVALNRAIALAEIDGPTAALAVLDRLALDGYRYFHSTRADLLRRLGRDGEARAAYARALALAPTEPERRFIERRLADLRPTSRSDREQVREGALGRPQEVAETESEESEGRARGAR